MNTVSILKTVDSNANTRDTTGPAVKWVQHHDLEKVQAQFREMQVKILSMFTLAKSELATSYKQVVHKVRKIEKYLNNENAKLPPCVLMYLQEITHETETKKNEMVENIGRIVVNNDLFDQLLSYFPESFVSEHYVSSQKRINNTQISSSRQLAQKTSNIVFEFDSIGESDYLDALLIRPDDKRISDLGLLSGRWKCLEGIDLENKQISMVVPLQTVIAENLQEINLSVNEISSLSFLEGGSFPLLRVLNLSKNSIKKGKNWIINLSGIEKSNLPNLKFLNLSHNNLNNIEKLKSSIFPELIDLNLSHNKIQNCKPLSSCEFPKLEILNVDYNELKSIEFLEDCYFYRLKIFSFCFNNIKELECLKNTRLEKLEALLGYNNRIESINFLEHSNFPIIKEIILNNNRIHDISVIEKLKFKYLSEFDLENNCIKEEEIGCFVTKNYQCRKAKKKYPFIQL